MILRRAAMCGLWLFGAGLLAGCGPAMLSESEEQVDVAELAMARHAYTEMLGKFPAYEVPAVQQYVRAVGARLAVSAPTPKNCTLQFTALDSPGVFAHSFANGEIVISRGLLVLLNTEDQLAAILGHEIGHIVSLHQTRQMREARRSRELETRLSKRLNSRESQDLVKALGLAHVRGYSREHEIEADAWSERLLARSGYATGANAQAMRLLVQIESFQDKYGFELWEIPREGGGVGMFATHPSLDSRLAQAIQRQGRAAQTVAVADPKYLRMLQGMLFGLSERYGVQRGNVYVHPATRVAFTVPPDWYLFGENDRLVAAPRGRDGLLIIRIADAVSNETRRHALEKMARDYALDPVVAHDAVGVKGEMAVARQQKGQERRSARFAVLDAGGKRLYVAGFTYLPEHWQEADVRYRAMLKSMRVLSENEAKRIQPLRVKIAEPGIQPAYSPTAQLYGDHPRQRWALLNQIYPQGDIPAGQSFKIVE